DGVAVRTRQLRVGEAIEEGRRGDALLVAPSRRDDTHHVRGGRPPRGLRAGHEDGGVDAIVRDRVALGAVVAVLELAGGLEPVGHDGGTHRARRDLLVAGGEEGVDDRGLGRLEADERRIHRERRLLVVRPARAYRVHHALADDRVVIDRDERRRRARIPGAAAIVFGRATREATLG